MEMLVDDPTCFRSGLIMSADGGTWQAVGSKDTGRPAEGQGEELFWGHIRQGRDRGGVTLPPPPPPPRPPSPPPPPFPFAPRGTGFPICRIRAVPIHTHSPPDGDD